MEGRTFSKVWKNSFIFFNVWKKADSNAVGSNVCQPATLQHRRQGTAFNKKLTHGGPFFRNILKRIDLRQKYNMLWFNLTAIQHLDNFCPVAQRALSKKASYNQVVNRGKILWLKQLQQKTHFSTDSANALD
jgi:hypothetical protein